MVMFNASVPTYPHKLRRLYWPLLALAEECTAIAGTVAGSFRSQGNRYTIPRFIFRSLAMSHFNSQKSTLNSLNSSMN